MLQIYLYHSSDGVCTLIKLEDRKLAGVHKGGEAARLRACATASDAIDGMLGGAGDVQRGHQAETPAADAQRLAFGGQFAQTGQIAGVAAVSHDQQRDQLGGRIVA